MVKYSDNTDYEQIDLATMYDLRDARLVLAQLVTVDRVNNCAEVTIAESCEELAGKDLSAVPFFYHCEDSTGTVEDLVRGHKAFRVDEFVYCLWAPAAADIDERFYIIGHADIRETRVCNVSEVIILRTRDITATYFTGRFYALIDANTGLLLDLDVFENLDESSPAKPSGAIGVWSTAVQDWISYNFKTPISPTAINFGATLETPSWGLVSWADNGSTGVNYTGTQGQTSGSTPRDCDAWHDPGNGGASFHGLVAGSPAIDEETIGEREVIASLSGAFGAHGSLTVNDCRAYFETSTYLDRTRMYSEKTIENNNCIRIDDNTEGTSYYITCWQDITSEVDNTASLSPITGDYYAEEVYRYSADMNFDFTAISRPGRTVSISSDCTQTYEVGWEQVDTASYFAPATSTGMIRELAALVSPCFNGSANVLVVGENGVYLIAYSGLLHQEVAASEAVYEGTVRVSGDGGWVLSGWPGYPAAYKPLCWGSGFLSERDAIPTVGTPHKFKVSTCALICHYNESFGGTENTTIGQCLQNYKASASTRLSTSVNTFYDYVAEQIDAIAAGNPLYVDIAAEYYSNVISYGPYFSTVVRGAGL